MYEDSVIQAFTMQHTSPVCVVQFSCLPWLFHRAPYDDPEPSCGLLQILCSLHARLYQAVDAL